MSIVPNGLFAELLSQLKLRVPSLHCLDDGLVADELLDVIELIWSPVLLEAAKNKEPAIRERAIRGLPRIGSEVKDILPAITVATQDAR